VSEVAKRESGSKVRCCQAAPVEVIPVRLVAGDIQPRALCSF